MTTNAFFCLLKNITSVYSKLPQSIGFVNLVFYPFKSLKHKIRGFFTIITYLVLVVFLRWILLVHSNFMEKIMNPFRSMLIENTVFYSKIDETGADITL